MKVVAHRVHAEELAGVRHRSVPVASALVTGCAVVVLGVAGRRPSTTWNLRPRKLLVHPDVARQTEHPLAQDVPLDLGGSALDRIGP